MLAARRIVFASAIAPLGVALPLFVVGLFSWATFPFQTDSPLSTISPLEFAALSSLQIYVPLAILCVTVAFLLRRLGVLSRRVLLIIGAAVSAMIGAWLSCDWSERCELVEGGVRFVVHGSTCFAVAGALSMFWWWLANRRPA